MQKLGSEIRFIWQLIKLSLAGLMEYRASFLMQAVGMFLNNGVYLVFWMLFFERFKEIKGYQMEQIVLLFGFVALSFGIAFTLAGNASSMAALIAQGRLDYYLTLPRPVLPHLLFSQMGAFSMGDLTFGLCMYFLTGRLDPVSFALYLLCAILAAVIWVSFATITGSMAFFMGNATFWQGHLQNTMITFSIYPMGLFQGIARLILFTLIPAAFVGMIPVEVVETHNFLLLGGLAGAASIAVFIAVGIFSLGLRHYEAAVH